MLTEENVRDAIGRSVMGVDAANLHVDTEFSEAGIDSLDHASILLALQEEYGLTVPDEDTDKCTSIRAIVEYAAERSRGSC